MGTYTYTHEGFVETTHAIFSGALGNLDWLELRPVQHGSATFAGILAGTVGAPKVILNP